MSLLDRAEAYKESMANKFRSKDEKARRADVKCFESIKRAIALGHTRAECDGDISTYLLAELRALEMVVVPKQAEMNTLAHNNVSWDEKKK